MATNYDAEYGNNQDPQWHQEPELSKWNTYIVRSILKGVSGILFAFSLIPIILYSWVPSTVLAFQSNFITFGLAICIWAVFYRMELQHRSHAPDSAL